MKKLSLKDLKVSSFVTKASIKIKGGWTYNSCGLETVCIGCPHASGQDVETCGYSEAQTACQGPDTACIYH
ncbi:pinensin family lanthipeptide [Roseivirga sp. BDSF3-8]|uniref:pinensin family lanthipeptide n=1 Tax=Roseivirga sp. BDSF3-8 TaxID=3241598 RepID=UPI003531E4E7